MNVENDVFRRVKKACSSIFEGETTESLDMSSTMETIPDWNSTNFLSLIVALEDEFNITIATLDSISLLSIEAICDYIETKNENHS